MTAPTPTLDTLTPADAHACWQMCQALRWPHREADLLRFQQWAERHGGTVALRADGRLIGCGFAFFWGETHGSIGMVIVDDAWQGRGLGKQMFNQLLALQGKRSVTLQATQAGLPLYERMGFHATGRARQFHGIWQPAAESLLPGSLAGSAPAEAPPAREGVTAGVTGAMHAAVAEPAARTEPTADTQPAAGRFRTACTANSSQASHLRPLQPADLPALLDWDSAARGISRQWLIRDLLQGLQPDERCTVSTTAGGQIDGYGVLRRFGRGWVLGPLLARDESHAQALIRHLTADHAGQFIRIDLAADMLAFAAHGSQAPGPQLGAWLQAQGLAMVDEPVTMTRAGTMTAETPPPAMAGTTRTTATTGATEPGSGIASGSVAAGVTITGVQPPHAPGFCALVAQAIS